MAFAMRSSPQPPPASVGTGSVLDARGGMDNRAGEQQGVPATQVEPGDADVLTLPPASKSQALSFRRTPLHAAHSSEVGRDRSHHLGCWDRLGPDVAGSCPQVHQIRVAGDASSNAKGRGEVMDLWVGAGRPVADAVRPTVDEAPAASPRERTCEYGWPVLRDGLPVRRAGACLVTEDEGGSHLRGGRSQKAGPCDVGAVHETASSNDWPACSQLREQLDEG
jgi:hypothetical protein